MRSVVSLYNTALARLGGAQLSRINSPNDEDSIAVLCRTLFPLVADKALEFYPWPFAIRHAQLAQVAGNTLATQNGLYSTGFALPADCIRPITLEGRQEQPYVLEANLLLTNTQEAALKYVARIHDPAVWSVGFYDAVAWGLAAELATAVINDARRQQFYTEMFTRELHAAGASAANWQNPRSETTPWVEARR